MNQTSWYDRLPDDLLWRALGFIYQYNHKGTAEDEIRWICCKLKEIKDNGTAEILLERLTELSDLFAQYAQGEFPRDDVILACHHSLRTTLVDVLPNEQTSSIDAWLATLVQPSPQDQSIREPPRFRLCMNPSCNNDSVVHVADPNERFHKISGWHAGSSLAHRNC